MDTVVGEFSLEFDDPLGQSACFVPSGRDAKWLGAVSPARDRRYLRGGQRLAGIHRSNRFGGRFMTGYDADA